MSLFRFCHFANTDDDDDDDDDRFPRSHHWQVLTETDLGSLKRFSLKQLNTYILRKNATIEWH